MRCNFFIRSNSRIQSYGLSLRNVLQNFGEKLHNSHIPGFGVGARVVFHDIEVWGLGIAFEGFSGNPMLSFVVRNQCFQAAIFL